MLLMEHSCQSGPRVTSHLLGYKDLLWLLLGLALLRMLLLWSRLEGHLLLVTGQPNLLRLQMRRVRVVQLMLVLMRLLILNLMNLMLLLALDLMLGHVGVLVVRHPHLNLR